MAGAALTWFHDRLGTGMSLGHLLEEATAIGPGSDGLYFLPYMEGMSSPGYRPTQRGAFHGLSLAHTRGHLVRSILEGVTYGLRTVTETLNTDVAHGAITGGGAQSRLWRQIVSDMLGCELHYYADGTSRGAAMLAAVGCGMHHSLEDVERAMVPPGEPMLPGPSHALYNEGYHEFRTLARLEEDA